MLIGVQKPLLFCYFDSVLERAINTIDYQKISVPSTGKWW